MANDAVHAVEPATKSAKTAGPARQQAASPAAPVTLDVGVGEQLGTGWMQGMMMQLQGAAGNAAVAAAIAARHGQGEAPPAVQRSKDRSGGLRLITVQRDGGHAVAEPASATELDSQARAIISAAQAAKPGIDQRAVNAVWAIINTYYPDKKATVSGVEYVASQKGLLTGSEGSGAKATGSIEVGEYFISNTTEEFFARRVLQVGHELEHITQYREGKGGEEHRHEREFLAFYHEALNLALAHTGRVTHKTRADMFDEAIRHYNAMPADQKRQYADQYRDLLERRTKELRKSHRGMTEPPKEAAP